MRVAVICPHMGIEQVEDHFCSNGNFVNIAVDPQHYGGPIALANKTSAAAKSMLRTIARHTNRMPEGSSLELILVAPSGCKCTQNARDYPFWPDTPAEANALRELLLDAEKYLRNHYGSAAFTLRIYSPETDTWSV